MEHALIGASAFALGLLLTPLAMAAAFRFGVLDRPVTELKKHSRPMPYLGGVAIFLAFAVPVIAAKLIMHQTFHGVIGILAGAALMMIVGLVDDVKNLTPYAKLVMQLIVAFLIMKAGIHIRFMENNLVNYAFTVLWVVGISNAMNLLDIMDGLAAGVAAVAALAFFAVSMMAGRVNDMIPAIALFGAAAAFLVYNKPPAKIYMGDAGSLFLGFMMAVLALNESYSRTNVVAVLSPVLILGVPIFDTFLVMMIRIGKGKLPIYGSNDHTAQRLVMLGMSKPMAVLFLVCVTAALSALAVFSTFLSVSGAIVLYMGIACAGMMSAMLVASVDMKDYHKVHNKRK
jgi:UDP-GlcNAc:undecaprenyl-phosphate/decaprenyl-phosphate GlcNAc-1-phosphate transferase